MPSQRPHLVALAPLALIPAVALLALAGAAPDKAAEPDPPAACDCELRSWVVAGRGRHLLLEIDCPPALDDLDGVVEFTSAALRDDYDPALDASGAPRIARMTQGVRLEPFLARDQVDERIEARWSVSPQAAACLQRDRLFAAQYILLGPNSNSAMASALASCGLALPDAVVSGAGILGEFPGIDLNPGDELPAHRWRDFGVLFAAE